jgi:hypothetical protein
MEGTCTRRSSHASICVLIEHTVFRRVLMVAPSLLVYIRPRRRHRLSGDSMRPGCGFCRIYCIWSVGGIVRAGAVVTHDGQAVSQSSKYLSWRCF